MAGEQAAWLKQNVLPTSAGAAPRPPAAGNHTWFLDTGEPLDVTFREFVEQADYEYTRWMSLGRLQACSTATGSDNLQHFIKNTNVDQLASLLDETPRGTTEFDFTPYQRLALVIWLHQPYTRSVNVHISPEKCNEVHRNFWDRQQRRRKIPVAAQMSTIQGFPRDKTLVDFCVGSGKTPWSLAAAAMLLSPEYWPKLCRDHTAKLAGIMFNGDGDGKLARVALIAAPGSTYNHFVATFRALLPRLQETWPAATFDVWEGIARHHSLKHAAEQPPEMITFWFIEMHDAKKAMSKHPEYAIPVVVWDEFTVDTPKNQGSTLFSPLLKELYLQATPSALTDATAGGDSPLRRVLGKLNDPVALESYIAHSSWKAATITANQYCMLKLMSMSEFRLPIFSDLERLVPPGIRIYVIRAKKVTLMAMANSNTDVDAVPANFENTLIVIINDALAYNGGLHDDSVKEIRSLATQQTITPQELLDTLRSLKMKRPERLPVGHGTEAEFIRNKPEIRRICERTAEITTGDGECHLCCEKMINPVVSPCCSYVFCNACRQQCTKCPFCRKPYERSFKRQRLPDAEPLAPQPQPEPKAPDPFAAPQFMPTLSQTLSAATSPARSQLDNAVAALHSLKHHGCKRLIIVVKRGRYGAQNSLYQLPLGRIQTATGYTFLNANIEGNTQAFAERKHRFDTPSDENLAFLCNGVDTRFLVGTDLCRCDGLLLVGNVDNIITQALGRVLRPCAARANPQQFVPVVKIYAA